MATSALITRIDITDLSGFVVRMGERVRLWNTGSGRELYHLGLESPESGGSVSGVAITPDGSTVAGAGGIGVIVWRVPPQEPDRSGK